MNPLMGELLQMMLFRGGEQNNISDIWRTLNETDDSGQPLGQGPQGMRVRTPDGQLPLNTAPGQSRPAGSALRLASQPSGSGLEQALMAAVEAPQMPSAPSPAEEAATLAKNLADKLNQSAPAQLSPAEQSIQNGDARLQLADSMYGQKQATRDRQLASNNKARAGRETSLPASLEERINQALSGQSVQPSREQSAYEFATTRPAGGSRKPAAQESPKPAGDLERLDEMFPGSRGKTTPVKGGSGNTNQLVRLMDGSSVMMGPDAYREYKLALNAGSDEKTALRSTRNAASERQATAMAPARAKALVREKGLAALTSNPGLQGSIDPAEAQSLSVARTDRLANQAANVQQRQYRANPLAAMLRNDGSDSPIAQQFMLMQTGMSPEDAAQIVSQRQHSQNTLKSQEADRELQRDGMSQKDRQAEADLSAREKLGKTQTALKLLEAEVDPAKRKSLVDMLSQDLGMASSPPTDGQMKPAVVPEAAPATNAKRLLSAVKSGNMLPEQAIAEAEEADKNIPFDGTKPRVKISDIVRRELKQKEWDRSPAGQRARADSAFDALGVPMY